MDGRHFGVGRGGQGGRRRRRRWPRAGWAPRYSGAGPIGGWAGGAGRCGAAPSPGAPFLLGPAGFRRSPLRAAAPAPSLKEGPPHLTPSGNGPLVWAGTWKGSSSWGLSDFHALPSPPTESDPRTVTGGGWLPPHENTLGGEGRYFDPCSWEAFQEAFLGSSSKGAGTLEKGPCILGERVLDNRRTSCPRPSTHMWNFHHWGW